MLNRFVLVIQPLWRLACSCSTAGTGQCSSAEFNILPVFLTITDCLQQIKRHIAYCVACQSMYTLSLLTGIRSGPSRHVWAEHTWQFPPRGDFDEKTSFHENESPTSKRRPGAHDSSFRRLSVCMTIHDRMGVWGSEIRTHALDGES